MPLLTRSHVALPLDFCHFARGNIHLKRTKMPDCRYAALDRSVVVTGC